MTGTGASGDKTLLADARAEEAIIRILDEVDDLRIVSEEAGTKGTRESRFVAVVDPLDGSANFERGIPFYCTSIAVSAGPRLRNLRFGIVRDLVNGDVFWAEKGKGATKNGRPIVASKRSALEEAVVGVDLSRGKRGLASRMGKIIGASKRQVHFGANALELCYLADGRIDAFVDIRRRMRVTDMAAAFLIASEAGAVFTDGTDAGLDVPLNLGARVSLVAGGNVRLHGLVADLLRAKSGT